MWHQSFFATSRKMEMNTSLNHTRIGTDMDILHKTAKNIENRDFAMSRQLMELTDHGRTG